MASKRFLIVPELSSAARRPLPVRDHCVGDAVQFFDVHRHAPLLATRAATPGSSCPSSHSRNAPPAVETYVKSSATPRVIECRHRVAAAGNAEKIAGLGRVPRRDSLRQRCRDRKAAFRTRRTVRSTPASVSRRGDCRIRRWSRARHRGSSRRDGHGRSRPCGAPRAL